MWERSKHVRIRNIPMTSLGNFQHLLNINAAYFVEKRMKDQNMFKLELYPHHTFEDVPTSFLKLL